MGSFDWAGGVRWGILALCAAACNQASTCERGEAELGRAAESANPSSRNYGDGIYEVIPRGPFHVDDRLRTPPPAPPKAAPPAPTVVLAVLDTVRADHTSLCDYERQTTPYLESLEAKGAAHTCRAYAPGDWSLPSHASYFTGVSVARHGAHYARDRKDQDGTRVRSLYVYPLRDGIPTLAEQMRERGYQTVLVSDNGLLGEAGLQRGFGVVATRPRKHDPRVDWVPPTLQRVLAEEVDPRKPLFLVLNYLQAHDPWVVPEFKASFGAFLGGKLRPEQLPNLHRQLVDLYDYGVRREDAALEQSLTTLERAGWLASGFRIAITADHGEMLMEHGMWRHSFVFEGNARIPFVYWTDGKAPSLPAPFPAVAVHGLLRDGALPEPFPPAETVAIPNPDNTSGSGPTAAPAAAMWFGDEKLLWIGGQMLRIDLARDPEERSPKPLGEHPRRAQLEALVAALQSNEKREQDVDPALVEQLRALGYVE